MIDMSTVKLNTLCVVLSPVKWFLVMLHCVNCTLQIAVLPVLHLWDNPFHGAFSSLTVHCYLCSMNDFENDHNCGSTAGKSHHLDILTFRLLWVIDSVELLNIFPTRPKSQTQLFICMCFWQFPVSLLQEGLKWQLK